MTGRDTKGKVKRWDGKRGRIKDTFKREGILKEGKRRERTQREDILKKRHGKGGFAEGRLY